MEVFNNILNGLSKGDFLETDGITYWWVNDGSYKEISIKTFKKFIEKKLVYSQRVDDETTCYYLSMQMKEKISPEFAREKSANDHKINQIRSFINL